MLSSAVKSHDIDEVRRILLSGKVDYVDMFTNAVLNENVFHFITRSSHPDACEILDLLLRNSQCFDDHSSPFQEKDVFGNTPLLNACSNSMKMAKMLIEAGARSSCIVRLKKRKYNDVGNTLTPLTCVMLYAGYQNDDEDSSKFNSIIGEEEYERAIGVMRLLLKNINVNETICTETDQFVVDNYLSLAAAVVNPRMMEILLEHNAEIHFKRFGDENDMKTNVLDIAAMMDDLDTIKVIMKHRRLSACNIDKKVLRLANPNLRVFKYLYSIYIICYGSENFCFFEKFFDCFKFAFDLAPSKIRRKQGKIPSNFEEYVKKLPSLYDMTEAHLYMLGVQEELDSYPLVIDNRRFVELKLMRLNF